MNQNTVSESEHSPRPPVIATQIPLRPRPSPSPTKHGQAGATSPVKPLEMMDSLNPLVTNGVSAPQNTPEKKQIVRCIKAYLHDTICRKQFLFWGMETSADARFLLVC